MAMRYFKGKSSGKVYEVDGDETIEANLDDLSNYTDTEFYFEITDVVLKQNEAKELSDKIASVCNHCGECDECFNYMYLLEDLSFQESVIDCTMMMANYKEPNPYEKM